MTATTIDQSSSFREHRIPRLSGCLYARDYPGAGPAFVLMHGLPDNLRIYDRLIPYLLAAGRRVVAFDFLGFGASDKPEGVDYGFEQQMADLLVVVDALGLGRIVPVGHDSSGTTAVNFALDHPRRTEMVVVLNSVFAEVPGLRLPEMIDLFADPRYAKLSKAFVENPARLGWLFEFQLRAFQAPLPEENRAAFTETLTPIIVENFAQRSGSGPAMARMASELYAEMARNSARIRELEASETPFRIVWGELDPYFGGEIAKALYVHLNRGTLLMVPAGHWLQIEAPKAVAEAMLFKP